MELTGFVPLVRRWWIVLVAAAAVAGVAANVVASRLPPTYEAQVSLLAGPINTDYGTLRASGELARTYSELATSGPVLRGAADEAGVDASLADLRKSVIASANEVTRIVTVRVRDEDPERATRFAGNIATRLTAVSTRVPRQDTEAIEEFMTQAEVEALPERARARVRRAATRMFGTPAAGRLTVVDEATVSDEPVAPPISLITVLATLAALLLAGVYALIREHSADAVTNEHELADIADAPVLASLDGHPRRGAGGPLVVDANPGARTAEAYRVLAAKIGLSEDEPRRSLLVVGADVGEGTGLLAANLAAALAESDRRVTLVDANTTDGEITTALGLDDRAGYAELLAHRDGSGNGAIELEGLRVERSGKFDVIPRGHGGDAGVVEVEHARRVLERLLRDAEVIVVNAPAIDRSPSALVWARLVDATLLVARENRSRREKVVDAVRSLELVDANLIGTVVSEGAARWRPRRRR